MDAYAKLREIVFHSGVDCSDALAAYLNISKEEMTFAYNHPKQVILMYRPREIVRSFRVGRFVLLVETDQELHAWRWLDNFETTRWTKVRVASKDFGADAFEAELRLDCE